MAEVEICWLESEDSRRQAGGVAARALRDTPISLAVSDDPLVRLEMLYSTFDGMLRDEAAPVGALRGGCVLGVAAFQPPGRCISSMLPPEGRSPAEPGPDASAAERFWHIGSVMAAHDWDEEHFHVGPVGVEPGFQGTGIGHAVMSKLCDHFDEQDALAWLETDKPENVRFYISLGFEVVEKVSVLSATYWFMRRPPKA